MSNEFPLNDGRASNESTEFPRLVGIGFAIVIVGASVQWVFGRAEVPNYGSVAAIALAIAGVIVAAFGVASAPRHVIAILVSAAAAWVATLATHPNWDSVRLLFQVVAAVGVFAAIVIMLPRGLQFAVVSGLAVFHFLGVFSAITSPQPQPWVSNWAWVTLFRPHLVFCYTNNAYQFYSPDPGPANLLWFCVELKDGTKTWYKIPRKPESRLDPMSVEFFRRLSITEFVNQNYQLQQIPQGVLEARTLQRLKYPLHPDLSQSTQYARPQENTLRTLGAYARHVANEYGPENVKSIRIYRVLHQMLTPEQFARGEDPFQPASYYPFYLGEYGPDGFMTDPNDPMLWWVVPILRKPAPLTPLTTGPSRPYDIENYLAIHAGSDPFQE